MDEKGENYRKRTQKKIDELPKTVEEWPKWAIGQAEDKIENDRKIYKLDELEALRDIVYSIPALKEIVGLLKTDYVYEPALEKVLKKLHKQIVKRNNLDNP